MNSSYDNSLTEYADELAINYKLISDISYCIENINTYFPFVGERINFRLLNNTKFVDSDQEHISFDAVNFIKSLLDKRICRSDDVVIYIGDSLTNNGYEFYLNDLLKIIPFLVSKIPQHHYVLFKDFKKIIYISFENEIRFGVIN
ncbi:hypothetical protein [Bacteroides uniformis]|uniref:hypothetical protein n=1 Tax=Bacteroides uniformis TaxID=820 RepID=UPI00232C51A3|nr:hypothetical protein [Bacteroides uniformis]MDC1832727.1 hypothetical protein [Bacteroides uniformis]